MEMKHISLFSGIGGFDLAAEWMGWENIAHCEWNDFGRKVLKYYWPNAISYEDITKTDFSIHRGQIDIVTGGFPCQPYSQAGKRLGKEDDRHLWPEMLRAIREIQPNWVVGENVRGLTNWNGGMVFDEVQADLESEGYEVTPFLLPAVAVNAPHRRDRIWFISRLVSNAGRNGQQLAKESEKRLNGNRNGIPFNEPDSFHGTGVIADTGLLRPEINEKQTAGIKQCDKRNVTNANGDKRRERRLYPTEREKAERYTGSRDACRHERSTWQNFPTQSPICSGNDGISSQLDGITFSKWRNESIKAGGNAIVPQLAYQIFKAIEQYNHGNNPPTRSE